MSLSCVPACITNSSALLEETSPKVFPASLNLMSAPSASSVISPEASIVKSPDPLSVKVVALLPSPVIDIEPAVIDKLSFIVTAPLK